MEEHPGIVFKNGRPAGEPPCLNGPDVWEVVCALQEIDERGEEAVSAVAELLNLPMPRVRTAMRYYADHAEEIDAEIRQNVVEAKSAYRAWQSQRRLLA